MSILLKFIAPPVMFPSIGMPVDLKRYCKSWGDWKGLSCQSGGQLPTQSALWKRRAAAPATCEVETEVPERVSRLPPMPLAVTSSPGARRSTRALRLEKGEMVSFLLVDATAVTFWAQAGAVMYLSPKLPDDATAKRPAAAASFAAWETGSASQYSEYSPPPKLMERTFIAPPDESCLQ